MVWFVVFFITSMISGMFEDLLHTYFILHRGHHRKKSLKISKHLYTNIFYHVSQRYIDINWTRDGFQFSIDNPYIVLTTVADIDTLFTYFCSSNYKELEIW
jgi:hypothetical protein